MELREIDESRGNVMEEERVRERVGRGVEKEREFEYNFIYL